MPALPEPTTRSPGSLTLHYTAGALEHVMSARFVYTVDFDESIATIRTEAVAFANAAKAVCVNSVIFTAWSIRNPEGIELYREVFTAPITGTLDPGAGSVASQSASFSLVGKGVSPTVGLRSGQARVMIFPNWFKTFNFETAKRTVAPGSELDPLLQFLRSSTVVGADFYGNHCEWSNIANTQVNAHFQKRYGL